MNSVSAHSRRGFSLVEIVLATAIITMFLVSISIYFRKVLDVSRDTTRHIQSGFLLEEGVETIKLLRDQGWTANIASLSTTTTYYFYWTGTAWKSTTTLQKVENTFTRSFTISDVKRDVSDNIASSGTYDPGTKKIVFTVSWLRRGGKSTVTESLETYVAQLFPN